MKGLISKTTFTPERRNAKSTSVMLGNNVKSSRQQRRYKAKLNRQANKEGNNVKR